MEGTIGTPGRGIRSDRDLTKGSIIGNLWSLSWPMTISSTIMMLGPAVDMIWIGKLGPASIAGVGISVGVEPLLEVDELVTVDGIGCIESAAVVGLGAE